MTKLIASTTPLAMDSTTPRIAFTIPFMASSTLSTMPTMPSHAPSQFPVNTSVRNCMIDLNTPMVPPITSAITAAFDIRVFTTLSAIETTTGRTFSMIQLISGLRIFSQKAFMQSATSPISPMTLSRMGCRCSFHST